MSGLREKQKETRRQAMLSAAARLFKEQGFARTSMEEIAAAAGLSVATAYNYFKTKGEICIAIYKADRDLVQAATDRVIANPPKDPVAAICKLIETDFETEVPFVDRGAWEALFLAALQSQPGVTEAWSGAALMRIDQFVRLLKVLQQRGSVSPAADIESAAELLGALDFSYFFHWIVEWRTGDGVTRRFLNAAKKRRLRAQVAQLAAGLLP
ncbi:MAG TPA: TetR/AcrR family transcriptional regulator [Dongiaceae bacterium]|jgi:AcrR family transcriptional regulator|nr:TetR/AcrR family transcriptional regulator [Dongiaceae bacterium]